MTRLAPSFQVTRFREPGATSLNFTETLEALSNNLQFLRMGEGTFELEPSTVDLSRYTDPAKYPEAVKDPAYLGALESNILI